jgi:hypothetical protein
MADTAIPITAMVQNTAVANPAGTAIVAANTHTITPTKGTRKLLLRLTNTTAATKILTVTAGDKPVAGSSGQGVLDVSLTDGSTTPQIAWVTIESARFMKSNGTIVITVAAATTGNIAAYQMP